MTDFTLMVAGIFVALGLHAWLWYTRRTTLAVIGLGLLFSATYVFSAQFLGRPRPTTLTAVTQTRDVLWSQIVPGEGIYVLLSGPRLYMVRWDYDLAKQLRKLQQKMGKGERMIMTFGPVTPGTFHVKPQEELPTKYSGEPAESRPSVSRGRH